MAFMKTMCIAVVDAGATMNSCITDKGSQGKIDLVKAFLSKFLIQRMLASKTFEFGLIAYGDDDTNNFINSSQGGYLNVNEIAPIQKPSPATFSRIESLSSCKQTADLIDGIAVGQDTLVRTNAGKAFNRVMLLITDGETEVEGLEDLEQIIAGMGSQVGFGLLIGMVGKVTPKSSTIKKENAKLLRSVAAAVNGRFLEMNDVTDGQLLLSGWPGLATKPSQTKSTLEVTPELKIPIVFWSKVMKVSVPTLKKEVLEIDSSLSVCEQNRYISQALNDPLASVGVVQRQTSRWNPDDPEEEAVGTDLVKGFRYGSQFLPISSADEESFTIVGDPVVQFLGSFYKRDLPRHHLLEVPYVVQGPTDYTPSRIALAALASALIERSAVALVRFVKKANAEPFLAALIPFRQSTGGVVFPGFLSYRLPSAEDIRDYVFPSLTSFSAEAEASTVSKKRKAVSAFVDSLTIQAPPSTIAGVTLFNPLMQNLHRTLCLKLNDDVAGDASGDAINDGEIQPVDFFAMQIESALKAAPMSSRAAPSEKGSRLSDVFALKTAESKKRKRKHYWSDIEVPSASSSSSSSAAASSSAPAGNVFENLWGGDQEGDGGKGKDDKEEEEEEEIAQFVVGSVRPVEDFQAVIAYYTGGSGSGESSDRAIDEAMETMTELIERNISVGETAAHHRRAVACLRAMRDGAVSTGRAKCFNSLWTRSVRQLSISPEPEHQRLWELIVQDGSLAMIKES